MLAKTAEDGTRLRGDLRVDAWPPRGAFPFGALVGLAVVYAGSMGRSPEPVTPATRPSRRTRRPRAHRWVEPSPHRERNPPIGSRRPTQANLSTTWY